MGASSNCLHSTHRHVSRREQAIAVTDAAANEISRVCLYRKAQLFPNPSAVDGNTENDGGKQAMARRHVHMRSPTETLPCAIAESGSSLLEALQRVSLAAAD